MARLYKDAMGDMIWNSYTKTTLEVTYTPRWWERLLSLPVVRHSMHDRLNSLLGDSVKYKVTPSREKALGWDDVILPAKIEFNLRYQEQLESAVFQRKFASCTHRMDLCITKFNGDRLVKTVKIYGAVCVPDTHHRQMLTFFFDDSKVDVE